MTRVALVCLIGVGAVAAGPATAQAAPSAAGAAKPVRTIEKGYALSCAGQSEGVLVAVDLYQNSAFGSHVSISVEGPDGEYGGGYGPEDVTLFTDGTVSADIPIRRHDDSGEPAGSAVVSGTYQAAGEPERVHEVVEDPAGRLMISRGTNVQLDTAVTVDLPGRTVPVSCPTAFAFDLAVWRYGTGSH